MRKWTDGGTCLSDELHKVETSWKEDDEDYYTEDTSSLASIYKAKI